MSFHENRSQIVPEVPRPGTGRISLVGAGPGASDLMTIRAVRCLGQADVVFYDRLVEPEALDFVHPAAQRVYVGKAVGTNDWPQDRIDTAIVSAALAGKHVVRLKSGDPSVFGRAGEEIAAARAHGIAVEIIPGITAASAAAASCCRPLTERGVTDRVVLATATALTGEVPAHVCDMAQPGTTMVFYMAMLQLVSLTDRLLASGVSADQAVTVAMNVSRSDEHQLQTTVARMAGDCRQAGIQNPAVVTVSLAKTPTLPLDSPARRIPSEEPVQ